MNVMKNVTWRLAIKFWVPENGDMIDARWVACWNFMFYTVGILVFIFWRGGGDLDWFKDDLGCGCDVDRRRQWLIVYVVVEVVADHWRKKLRKKKNWKWVQTAAAVAEAGAGAEVVAQESVRFALIDIPIAMLLTGEIQVGVSGFFFFNYLFAILFTYSNVLVRMAGEEWNSAVLEEDLNVHGAVCKSLSPLIYSFFDMISSYSACCSDKLILSRHLTFWLCVHFSQR